MLKIIFKNKKNIILIYFKIKIIFKKIITTVTYTKTYFWDEVGIKIIKSTVIQCVFSSFCFCAVIKNIYLVKITIE
jgi:hypothetical protein